MRRGSDTAVVLVGQLAAAAAQFFLFAVIGHRLGQVTLGHYAVALAVSTPVFLACGLSMRIVFVSAPEDWAPRWFLRQSLTVAFACACICVPVAVLIGGVTWSLAALVASVKFLDLLGAAGLGVLQRRRRIRIGSALVLLGSVVTVVLATVFGFSWSHLNMVVIGSLLGSLAAAVTTWTVALRGEVWRISGRLTDIVRRGFPLGMSNAIVSLALNLPTFYLAQRGSLGDAAAYSVIANLRTLANMGYSALAQVALVGMSECVRRRDIRGFLQMWIQGTATAVAVGVVAGGLLVVTASHVIPFVFGVDIASWRQPMVLVAIGFVAAAIVFVADSALSALNSYRVQFVSAACALVAAFGTLEFGSGTLGMGQATAALAIALTAASIVKVFALFNRVKGLRVAVVV